LAEDVADREDTSIQGIVSDATCVQGSEEEGDEVSRKGEPVKSLGVGK
jgi:hypothetical protein